MAIKIALAGNPNCGKTKSLLGIYGSILFESSFDSLVIAEKVKYLFV